MHLAINEVPVLRGPTMKNKPARARKEPLGIEQLSRRWIELELKQDQESGPKKGSQCNDGGLPYGQDCWSLSGNDCLDRNAAAVRRVGPRELQFRRPLATVLLD
jgi:hypothetical protein